MGEKLVIEGGRKLSGRVQVSGSKNSALPLLAATLLASEGKTVLKNVPDLRDIQTQIAILRDLGVNIEKREPSTLACRVEHERSSCARYELVSQMRASICVLGPLLAKRGYAKVSLPGGCVIGLRPVDLHVKGLRALGAEIDLDHGYLVARAPKGRLRGARIFLGGSMGSSVLATANTLMAACLADGKTIIEGAACEPEVNDLAHLLNRMGATIEGIGTPQLTITGVPELHGATATVIPDRIEAGTFMVAAAMTGSDMLIENVVLDHLGAVVDKLAEVGVYVREEEEGVVRVHRDSPDLRAVHMTTLPYPGYPTDIQAQLVSMLAVAKGISVVTEKVFPDRFIHLAELNRMGADIHKEGASAIVRGVEKLAGAPVMASDLRASAALVLAGLVAEGTTEIHRVYHIDRGYEKIEAKLKALGASVTRVEDKTGGAPCD
ncbi:UDP-N-acetylglucosamine 1-carboxyvinyltransferase [bacterium]|nr:UDP-N-acetylglucosamine 1-carboxyvinyltransferase [bacterium]